MNSDKGVFGGGPICFIIITDIANFNNNESNK